jgi:hypothetical protein
MAEPSQYMFAFNEIAETLVKKQGIHEGLWSITVKFGIQAANIGGFGAGPLLPTAIILEIGIQKLDKPNELSVDAAKVNPRKKKAKPK